jgi:hypothetical protein
MTHRRETRYAPSPTATARVHDVLSDVWLLDSAPAAAMFDVSTTSVGSGSSDPAVADLPANIGAKLAARSWAEVVASSTFPLRER